MSKKILFSAITLAGLFLLVELISFVGLKVLASVGAGFQPRDMDAVFALATDLTGPRAKKTYFIADPDLGWAIRPNGINHNKLYRSNSIGIRGDREYALEPEKFRVAAFGDSFTHGDEVGNDDTWAAQLSAEKSKDLEVMNFGVGGQAPDQALLRYRKIGHKYNANVVVLGLMPENINRVVNRFRGYYSPGVPFSKPRYILKFGDLTLVKNPFYLRKHFQRMINDSDWAIRETKEHDYWYDRIPDKGPLDGLNAVLLYKNVFYLYKRLLASDAIYTPRFVYREDTEALRVLVAITKAFAEEAEANGSKFVVLIYPTQRDIRNFMKDERIRYRPYLEALEDEGIEVIDLMQKLKEQKFSPSIEELFGNLFHYTRRGHAFVAKHIYAWMKAKAGL